MRLFLAVVLLSASSTLIAACSTEVDVPGSAGASSDGACPPPNPGMCAPSPTCVDGLAQTGSASCVNGAWVCGVEACTPDAGSSDSSCDGTPVPGCSEGKIVALCCPPDGCVKGFFCDLGNGACSSGACVDAGCVKAIYANHYDQSCSVDSDCTAVYNGSLCGDCFCENGAIATSALMTYESDLEALGPFTNACDCPAFPPPTCKAGVCTENFP